MPVPGSGPEQPFGSEVCLQTCESALVLSGTAAQKAVFVGGFCEARYQQAEDPCETYLWQLLLFACCCHSLQPICPTSNRVLL
ncbi:hypothetical protein Y1Q_0012417 [Alligator mississippiensis]|uniref:Uncharacterized protein n=1 Tax=Alligator mississippiensis TaxID=8496 RepID=A0A151NCR9_ALLMI|nr:hypothetical protein Y1Q_0012417 [Alligator mississippiensis]